MIAVAIAIRPARGADAEAVARLTGELGYDLAPSAAAERLTRLLAKHDQRFLIAEADGHIVGWLHATVAEYIEADPFVVIAGLVVQREHRSQGVGRALVARAEDWARERGIPIVRLWSSAPRERAHRFYERLGYAHVKTQYAFVKHLDAGDRADLTAFVPRVEP